MSSLTAALEVVMDIKRFVAAGFVVMALAPLTVDAKSGGNGGGGRRPTVDLFAFGLQGASGSTIGPDGALYVTQGAIGEISRVDLHTGLVTTFASGLPNAILPIGGVIDVAFLGKHAYALVTLVGSDVGGTADVGIYRVNGPNHELVANIGEFAINNPPHTDFQVLSGLQFAMEVYRGAFLVTDGHHNRLLRATLDGTVSEVIAFDNIVPTGLEVLGRTVLMAQAGPVPHLPEDGKIVALHPRWPFAKEIASGARLLVDVELGRGSTLYGLSQGEFPDDPDTPPGSPALPNTGALVKVNSHGAFDVVYDELNLPTSVEIVGDTAYVVNLVGEVWRIRGL
jgi:hypothetical protein